MEKIITNLYNNSMVLAENVHNNSIVLDDTQKSIIFDVVGALLETVGIADFQGTYSLEELKQDIKRV